MMTVEVQRTELTWPINGLAYVCLFMGPISAGPIIGIVQNDWRAGAIGFFGGIVITILGVWFDGKVLNPAIRKFQTQLQNPALRAAANVAAFSWAILLTGIAMLLPVVIVGISDVH
jgi:hypothetical protein